MNRKVNLLMIGLIIAVSKSEALDYWNIFLEIINLFDFVKLKFVK